ncbi:MFS transporter [soil metagenome]
MATDLIPPEAPLEAPRPTGAEGAALAPLRRPVFRMLWTAWMIANICMWTNDVAAAWVMTTLKVSPLMVALIQTASTAPVFLLGVPSGALADILDRRMYFLVTQIWIAFIATLLCIASLADALTPATLLLLTFLNGIGLAMRWPVFAAVVPELVPRNELPAALALNGVAMNISRIVGPVIAGAMLASIGSHAVFIFNGVMSLVCATIILRWKREQTPSSLPGERFFGAMRVGLQYVRESPRMRAVMLRVALFFLQSTALLALLPLVAIRLNAHGDSATQWLGTIGGGAATFTLMLASLGAGAIYAALQMPKLRGRFDRSEIVTRGSWVQAVASLIVAYAPNLWVALPAMVVAGMSWIAVANSLSVSAQLGLPNWVRARGMSMFQMSIMGASAIGAAVWGQLATVTDLATSLTAAAVTGSIAVWLTRNLVIESDVEQDLTPLRPWDPPETVLPVDSDAGPVVTTIEYRVDAENAVKFHEVMADTRRARLKGGALSWELFRDTADPDRYIEYIVDETWVEHLRRFDRTNAEDVALRERRHALQMDGKAPVVSRCISETFKR